MQALSSIQCCLSNMYAVASSKAEACAVACMSAVRGGHKVSHSLVGQAVNTVLKSAIRENAAEFVGTLFASKIVTQVSSGISSMALTAVPIVATVASQYIGASPLVTAVTFGAGILGGYVGVRLTGSSEPLLNRTAPLHCYTTKALQASALVNVVDAIFSPAPGVLTFLGNLALDGLAFNAVDIGNCIRAFINKRVLDQVLPARLDEIIVGELSECIETTLKNGFLSTAEVIDGKQVRKKIASELVIVVMKLFNQYGELLSNDETVKTAQTDFDEAFNKFYQETDLGKKDRLASSI